MHHLHARHEPHPSIYNKWLNIKASYIVPIAEAKDVTMHVLTYSPYEDLKYLLPLLIWASLYDPESNEVLKPVVTSPMSLENLA